MINTFSFAQLNPRRAEVLGDRLSGRRRRRRMNENSLSRVVFTNLAHLSLCLSACDCLQQMGKIMSEKISSSTFASVRERKSSGTLVFAVHREKAREVF